MNEINPDTGTAKLGDSVIAAYLPQHIKFEKEELSIIETVKRELKIAEDMAIPLLIKFKFCKEDFYKAVYNISGGEKIRLKICILMQKNVNLLLLDEPTNHLDFQAREWLENAIDEFTGTLIFVTHDR
jgi:ATPase subunit of ABC transporter with duplicated ATPase domains